MITAINSATSFGKTTKTDFTTRELRSQKKMNNIKEAGLDIVLLAGYVAGTQAINKVTKCKSYTWNTAINKTIKNISDKMPKLPYSDKVKPAIDKLGKTSGRQKLLAGATLLALCGFYSITKHFSKKNGEINAVLKNRSL